MGKRIIIVTVLLVFILSIWNTYIVAAEDDGQKLNFKIIDDYIIREMKKGNIPGLALGIVRGDSIVYLKGYGHAGRNRIVTEKTSFGIGSIGKTFTALAVRQLINEGKIDENTLVHKYIKGFQPTYQGEVENITVFQLLTHTSGLSAVDGYKNYLYNSKYSLEELVNIIGSGKLNRPSGSSYEYSNLNHLVLGLLIEKVSGESYEMYIQNNIFDKLNMEHSYLDKSEAVKNGLADGHNIVFGLSLTADYPFSKAQLPAGNHFSSAEDMARYLLCYLNKGYDNGISIIPNNTFTAPAAPLSDSYKDNWYDEYWFENSGYPKANLYLNYYGHDGANPDYASSIRINQKSRYGIVVLANSNDQTNFFKPEVAPWTISKGLMEYIETGKLPPDIAVKGSYERVGWIFLFLGLIGFYAFVSMKYLIRSKRKRIRALFILSTLLIDFIFPLLTYILMQLYYDNNWRWLLSSNPEQNYLILVSIGLLFVIGMFKMYNTDFLRFKK